MRTLITSRLLRFWLPSRTESGRLHWLMFDIILSTTDRQTDSRIIQTHPASQCAAVITMSSLIRDPPQIWRLRLCTETMYSIVFLGTICPFMILLPWTKIIHWNERSATPLVGQRENNRYFLTTLSKGYHKVEKQQCTKSMHVASTSRMYSREPQAEVFILF